MSEKDTAITHYFNRLQQLFPPYTNSTFESYLS